MSYNPFGPDDDEYTAYEKLADSKLQYCVIEASNHVSLSDFVSTALKFGLDLVGGPVVVDGIWHQAVSATDPHTMARWMASERRTT